ncbi:MAG: glucosaminidase domain-containing protein [Cellvibrionaceae bacterium]
MYPSAKSNFLFSIFILYTITCVGITCFFIQNPLLSIVDSKQANNQNSAQLLKETYFPQLINTKKPNFKDYKEVTEKKNAFFNYLIPKIHYLNANIAIQRKNIFLIKKEYEHNGINNTTSEPLEMAASKKSIQYLKSLSKRYKIKTEKKSIEEIIDQLLLRVDQIPPSMILAQAANESAWGTSRFATKANNFFGQWCFRKGCGIIPKRRGDDEYHEVAKFKTVYHSLESYFLNINTHNAYRSLRRHRATLRNEGGDITGLELINHLSRYSQRGEHYVSELRNMIKSNQLAKLDSKKTALKPTIQTL